MALEQGVPGQTLRVDEDREIAGWLKRLAESTASRGEWQASDGDQPSTWRELTGSESVFTSGDQTQAFELPASGNGQALEVIGIPLREPGFHVVELASPRLGAHCWATTGRAMWRAPHWSPTWRCTSSGGASPPGSGSRRSIPAGRRATLAYASAATVRADAVGGRDRRRRDRCGRQTLGEPHGDGGCNNWSPEPLMVSARSDGDMSFALSAGRTASARRISRCRSAGRASARTFLAHTVFDRTLLRAGETVSMKHFFRQHVSAGPAHPADQLRQPGRPSQPLIPSELVLTHAGSGQTYRMPVRSTPTGIAETSWPIPQDAKLGEYQVDLVQRRTRRRRPPLSGREVQRRAVSRADDAGGHSAARPPLVRPKDVTLDLFVSYLSGRRRRAGAGPAAHDGRAADPAFRDYPDFLFGGEDVRAGISDLDQRDDEAWWYALHFGYDRPGDGGAAAAARCRRSRSTERARRAPRSRLPAIDARAASSPSSSTKTRTASYSRRRRACPCGPHAQPRHTHRGLGRDARRSAFQGRRRRPARQAARGAGSRSTCSSATPTPTASG